MGQKNGNKSLFSVEIFDDDIYEAMKEIPGYIDVTPGDLKEIYAHAYRHAFDRITSSVRARDLMNTQVHTVERETMLRDVADMMAKNQISGVPVVEKNRHVVGVISEKDFCKHMGDRRVKSLMEVIAECVKNQGCLAMTIRERKAEDIMTTPAITVQEDAVLMKITAVLSDKDINRIPVVDPKGVLVGIITRTDIVRISFNKQS